VYNSSCMESAVRFNKLYVIESLGEQELHTGQHLLGEVEQDIRNLGLGLTGWKAKTAHDVRRALAEILDESASGNPKIYPILQIDTHGDERDGLALASGESIGWQELASSCREINAACENNLIVVANLCHGIGAIASVAVSQLTPFYALIGPSDTMAASDADSMSLFYRELLQSGDIEGSLAKLPHKLEYYLSERLLLNAFAGYIRDACKGRGRRERAERLLSDWQRLPAAKRIPIGKARTLIKQHIAPTEETFERWKSRFLMADHPDNTGRFQATFHDAASLADGSKE
jgi:hypothetical protein